MIPRRNVHAPRVRASNAWVRIAGLAFLVLTSTGALRADEHAGAKIVLPPQLAAGQEASLAVLSADGQLVPGAEVRFSNETNTKTDTTGCAYFSAPSEEGVLVAHLEGSTAVAVARVLPPNPPGPPRISHLPAWVSQHDAFTVEGDGFAGDGRSDHVEIGGKSAVVLASSPFSLVLLAGPQTSPGTAPLLLRSPSGQVSATVTFVALEMTGNPEPLARGKRVTLSIRALGTEQPLAVHVTNVAPQVLQLQHGNSQQLETAGGTQNTARLEARGKSNGDYSLDLRIAPPARPADYAAARAFLHGAAMRAKGKYSVRIEQWVQQLSTTTPKAGKVSSEIQKLAQRSKNSDVTALLRAAQEALQGRTN